MRAPIRDLAAACACALQSLSLSLSPVDIVADSDTPVLHTGPAHPEALPMRVFVHTMDASMTRLLLVVNSRLIPLPSSSDGAITCFSCLISYFVLLSLSC